MTKWRKIDPYEATDVADLANILDLLFDNLGLEFLDDIVGKDGKQWKIERKKPTD